MTAGSDCQNYEETMQSAMHLTHWIFATPGCDCSGESRMPEKCNVHCLCQPKYRASNMSTAIFATLLKSNQSPKDERPTDQHQTALLLLPLLHCSHIWLYYEQWQPNN